MCVGKMMPSKRRLHTLPLALKVLDVIDRLLRQS